MFNSKKINTDPKPWLSDPMGRRSSSEYGTEFSIGDWDRRFAPRPEFDNNPNPILLDLRDYWRHMGIDKPDAGCARIYLESTAIEQVAGGSSQHIAHAYQVLTRLAKLNREGNQ